MIRHDTGEYPYQSLLFIVLRDLQLCDLICRVRNQPCEAMWLLRLASRLPGFV